MQAMDAWFRETWQPDISGNTTISDGEEQVASEFNTRPNGKKRNKGSQVQRPLISSISIKDDATYSLVFGRGEDRARNRTSIWEPIQYRVTDILATAFKLAKLPDAVP
jgi:hypothetical protein